LKRGEVWTQAGGSGYARKPRPVLIVQSDLLIQTDSIIICLFTSREGRQLTSRLHFEPDGENGLNEPSDLMVDKIMTVARTKLGRRLGEVNAEDMARVEDAMLLVLGFAG
jgi:mRNA interferase MazF